jgi:hypothetical protein
MPESVDATQPALDNSGDEFAGLDTRSPEVRRLDYMADLVVRLTESVQKVIEHAPHSHTQTIIHKTQGMGTVGVICATVSIMCVLFMILGAIVFVPDIHDLKAWNDITRKDIARLQAQQEKGK